jgi:hypothetical protein
MLELEKYLSRILELRKAYENGPYYTGCGDFAYLDELMFDAAADIEHLLELLGYDGTTL